MNRSDPRDLLDPREKLGHKARQVRPGRTGW